MASRHKRQEDPGSTRGHQEEFMESVKVLFQQQAAMLAQCMQGVAQTGESFVPVFASYVPGNEQWDSYYYRLEQHFKAYRVTADERKRAYFLSWIGAEIYGLLQNLLGISDVGAVAYAEIVNKLNRHFVQEAHVLSARYKFHQSRMKGGQTYNEWVAELRGLARECRFRCSKEGCGQSAVDESIRDMLVLHTPHERVRTRALQLANPTLEEVMAIARAWETTTAANALMGTETQGMNQISSEYRKAGRKASPVRDHSWGSRTSSPTHFQTPRSRSSASERPETSERGFVPNHRKSCRDCFVKHTRYSCRFYRSCCDRCGKRGHHATVCCSPDDACLVDEVQTLAPSTTGSRYHVEVEVNGTPVRMLVDSGATCSMITLQTYQALGAPQLQPPTTRLQAYGGSGISLVGCMMVHVTLHTRAAELMLLVTDTPTGTNILGTPWFEPLGIQLMGPKLMVHEVGSQGAKMEKSVDELCKRFGAIFEAGLGTCNSYKVTLRFKEGTRPKFFKPRPVPFSQHEAVKREIDRLVEAGIVKQVKFSEWAAPIVIVPKPGGKIRMCGDFKVTVNPQLEVEQYPLPRFEELLQKLKNGKRFSKIDLADAYLQLELDEEAKKVAVINTPFGLYQYQRLPFGIASAPAIFQALIEQVISGIPGCANYLDDIIVTGATDHEHMSNLEALFQRLRDHGLRVNRNKCVFFEQSAEYLGHVLSEHGVKPSEANVAAVKNLRRPANLAELQSFLGKVNYYNKFIPNFATICGPLNELRRKGCQFVWGKKQEAAFLGIKNHIVQAAQLAVYKSEYPLILAADASSYGVGAVLSTRYPDGSEHPIAFASKTLNDAEKNYSQIEKEALSIIFGVKKFHQYLYGRPFELLTDHKPLVSLFHPDKKLPVYTLARLQRWAITLMGYQYTIRYRPSKHHGNADAMSRLAVEGDPGFDAVEESCNWLERDHISQLAGFPLDSCRVAEETKKDPLLSQVLELTTHGWPEHCPTDLKAFFDRRFSITSHSGVLLLEAEHRRVIVPKSLQPAILHMLHEGHWGIVRMKQMARRHCWWYGIDTAIEQLARDCEACQAFKPSPPREYQSWPTPKQPWERVHIDFAGPFSNDMWLLVVDAFSNYPYIKRMQVTTSAAVMAALREIFLVEGPPETLVSDNGPQFVSAEFEGFCKRMGIKHLTTAPFHPASNGEAERWVRTFKGAMKKALHEGRSKLEALDTLLFSYRTTPSMEGKSPAEWLHGRQPRTMLSLLKPAEAAQNVSRSKFSVGEKVLVKFFSGVPWVPGTIKGHKGRMMYVVDTQQGTVSRHQNQLRLAAPRGILRTSQSMGSAGVDGVPQKKVRFHPDQPRRSTRSRRPPARYQPA